MTNTNTRNPRFCIILHSILLSHCCLFLIKYRSFIFPKLIFLDQLCELSPYLPRSTLESHIPYTIIRSVYHQCYSGSFTGPDLTLTGPSPKQSPLISLSHASPTVRPGWVDAAPRSNNGHEQGQYVSTSHEETYEMDAGSKAKGGEKFLRSMRRSGPLDYSASRKVKFAEGSTSNATSGSSPMQRFAVSRSGPLLYK